jgi:hypothetical protein
VWGKLRGCEHDVIAKQLLGKPADPAKCTSSFETKIAQLSQKASSASVECRYADAGAGTVLDYDTGLQWEKKDGADGVVDVPNAHDVDNTYIWEQFVTNIGEGFLDRMNNCASGALGGYNGTLTGGLAGHCDWRLPSTAELLTILAAPYPCGATPCINSIFGPTAADYYWSSTTFDIATGYQWAVSFADGQVLPAERGGDAIVRARVVRSAL